MRADRHEGAGRFPACPKPRLFRLISQRFDTNIVPKQQGVLACRLGHHDFYRGGRVDASNGSVLLDVF
jgi:hypothetical protein